MGIILLQHTLQDADTTIITFNTLTSGLIQAVGKKNSWIARGFARQYLCPVSIIDLVEMSKDAASLVVCTRKKIFAWWMRVVCE